MRISWSVPLVFLACVVFSPSLRVHATDRRPLTFDERVKAQGALERVYYAHRIWPKDNPAPKPPFEEMVPREVIEAKVTDYLKKCAALDQYWQRPIQTPQLQAEMERMTRGTKDPSLLGELFSALDNDPRLIRECLARPLLTERLVRNWYATDPRFHGVEKEQAQRAHSASSGDRLEPRWGGHLSRVRIEMEMRSESESGDRGGGADDSAPIRWLDPDAFRRERADAPPAGAPPRLRETRESFQIVRTVAASTHFLEMEILSFPKRSWDEWWRDISGRLPAALPTEGGPSGPGTDNVPQPSLGRAACQDWWTESTLSRTLDPRYDHAAVWTGTEMLVWGGRSYGAALNTGARYDPSTDTWAPLPGISGSSCPPPSANPVAVWTGSCMVVWGGRTNPSSKGTGGRFYPALGQWVPTSTGTDCPLDREGACATWTGTEMVVFGGYNGASYLDNGGRYNPETDTWIAFYSMTGGVRDATIVWTGTEIILFGGAGADGPNIHGVRCDLATGQQLPIATCPVDSGGRARATAVWTGSEMIVWGGVGVSVLGSGARYSPDSDSWVAVSSGQGCPSPRFDHTSVWTGTEMIVWGGWNGSLFFDDGSRYDPSNDSWSPVSEVGALAPRSDHAALWTGTEMIVWGGRSDTGTLATGGRYAPASDSWVPTAQGPEGPEGRSGHTLTWTGAEVVAWGGLSDYYLKSGGRFSPATDSWIPSSVEGDCPAGRSGHTAIWTGKSVIIWGGTSGATLQSGAGYNPASNSWVPLPQGTGCPSARYRHTAVWTGTEMVVWGGAPTSSSSSTNTGGRYNPSTGAWRATPTTTGCPSARSAHTAVWTGTEMIVWGGNAGGSGTNTGGRFRPDADGWVATPTGTGCPSARYSHSAVWTGAEMVIWGGRYSSTYSSGGRFAPDLNTWRATATGGNCIAARMNHPAVWTGREMVIWGGSPSTAGTSFLATGGRYRPSLDDGSQDPWLPMATEGCPTARSCPAVWTGESMIVWGGNPSSSTGGIHMMTPGPLAVPEPSLVDTDSCGLGIAVTWPPDPGDWNDTGSGTRGYLVLRDQIPIPSGPCSGFLPYGTGVCTDTSVSSPGPHSYQVAYFNGCAAVSLSGLAEIADAGEPLPLIEGPASACQGITVTLTTGSYQAYQWLKDGIEIPGALSATLDVSEAGAYAVRVLINATCTLTSLPNTVTHLPAPTPTVEGPNLTCTATTVNLNTQSYSAYQWYRDGGAISGATGNSYQATSTGVYTVRVTGSNGCQGTSPPHAVILGTMSKPGVGGIPFLCAAGETTLWTAPEPECSYQWFRESYSAGAGPTLPVKESGSYYVRGTNPWGCTADSASVTVRVDAAVPTFTTPDQRLGANPNSTVRALAERDGVLYIGGDFTSVSPATPMFVTVDGTSHALDATWPASEGQGSVLPDGHGGWFVASASGTVGHYSSTSIFHLKSDRTVDMNFMVPTDGSVDCMVLSGNSLFLGGQFTAAGGYSRKYLAALDTKTGEVLPWNPSAGARVFSMAILGNAVYLGGDFQAVSGKPRSYLAAVDAETGELLPWAPTVSTAPYRIAAAAGAVYAVGPFYAYDARAWDAVTGSQLSWAPWTDGTVSGVAATSDAVYLWGSFSRVNDMPRKNMAAVDPRTDVLLPWDPQPDASVTAVVRTPEAVYVGGYFQTIGGQARKYLAELDPVTGAATTWDPSLNSAGPVLGWDGMNLAITGSFSTIAPVKRNYLAAIDTRTGSLLPWDPSPDGAVSTLVSDGSAILAGGSFTTIGGQARNRIASLDPVTGAANPWNPNADGPVTALLPVAGKVYVSGTFGSIGGRVSPYLAALDPMTGLASPKDFGANGSMTFATDGTTLYCGGSFTSLCGEPRTRLAALDANGGKLLPWAPTASGAVSCLLLENSRLYLGGSFTNISGLLRNYAASIHVTDGLTSWNPSASKALNALATDGESIFAKGNFTTIGGQYRNRLAALDPETGVATEWNHPASSDATALLIAGTRLYTGGATALRTDDLYPSCGEPVSLVAEYGWRGYQWFRFGDPIPGATERTYEATESGVYAVLGTSSLGCELLAAYTEIGFFPALPEVAGSHVGCAPAGVILTAGGFESYQWFQDGSPIPGATAATLQVLASGVYSVRAINERGCAGMSEPFEVSISAGPEPSIQGEPVNTCPLTAVKLLCPEEASGYQWERNGLAIPGATHAVYWATSSGDYTVTVSDGGGCSGTSASFHAVVNFCPTTEVSPAGGIFPLRLEEDAASPTGLYLYFQRVDSAAGYNIYEGTTGAFYSHGDSPDNLCNPSAVDLGTGEMRAAVSPAPGNRYFLVTAFAGATEGPSGFGGSGAEIPRTQSTCEP